MTRLVKLIVNLCSIYGDTFITWYTVDNSPLSDNLRICTAPDLILHPGQKSGYISVPSDISLQQYLIPDELTVNDTKYLITKNNFNYNNMKIMNYKLNPNTTSTTTEHFNDYHKYEADWIGDIVHESTTIPERVNTKEYITITPLTPNYNNDNTTKPEDETPKNKNYEYVNHPSHYNNTSIETIEKMRRIWGNQLTALWCEMTAFKYRDRIGTKPDNSNDQEVNKIKWYESKAKELYHMK